MTSKGNVPCAVRSDQRAVLNVSSLVAAVVVLLYIPLLAQCIVRLLGPIHHDHDEVVVVRLLIVEESVQ